MRNLKKYSKHKGLDGYIPYDAEIEYIESEPNMDQWIDTGIVPNTNTKIQIKFNNITATSDCIIGYRTISDTTDYRLFSHRGGIYFDAFESRISNSDASAFPINTVCEWELGNFYIKDLTTGNNILSGSAYTGTGVSTITLNHFEAQGEVTSNSQNRWYYVKIWDGDTLVRDMIPVRVGQVGYMYDKVSDQLFATQGVRNFILGEDIGEGKPYGLALGYNVSICKTENHVHYDKEYPYDSKVVYIEFPVGAYIDSGIIPTNATGFSYHFQRLSSTLTYVIGYRHYNSTNSFILAGGYNMTWVSRWNDNTARDLQLSTTSTDYNLIVITQVNYYNSRKVSYNGTEINTTLEDLSFTPTKSMYVGAVRVADTTSLCNNAQPHRCYGCVITEGDKIVRDYVPVRIGEVGYLYDRVSGRLFGNAGTGTITVGNDAI